MASGDQLQQHVDSKSNAVAQNVKPPLKWPIRREDYELLDVIGKSSLYSFFQGGGGGGNSSLGFQ